MIKLFYILFLSTLMHPVHVSMSSLWTDNDSGEIYMTVRLYTDDLALDLYRLYDAEGEYVELDHRFLFKGDDSYYGRYINDNLEIKINGKRVEIELEKKEMLELETLLTFRVISGVKKIKRVDIENKILSGLYHDQVNLFIVGLGETEKGLRFTGDKLSESITYN